MPILSPREIVAEHSHTAAAVASAEGRPESNLDNLAFITEDAEFTAPGGINLRGREQRSDYYRVWEEAFSDRTTEDEEVIVSGSTVVTESTFRGRHTGVFRIRGLDHIPPTGKDVRVSLLSIQDVKRGRIVSTRFYFDRLEFLEQLSPTEHST